MTPLFSLHMPSNLPPGVYAAKVEPDGTVTILADASPRRVWMPVRFAPKGRSVLYSDGTKVSPGRRWDNGSVSWGYSDQPTCWCEYPAPGQPGEPV